MNVAKKIVAFLFIAIVGLFVINTSLFTHSHLLNDGSVITHAHPFQKSDSSSPFEKHKHSNEELFALQNLSLLFFIAFIPFIFEAFLRNRELSFFNNKIIDFDFVLSKNGRAPPFIF